MRFEKRELGYYTDLYQLKGAEDKKMRYINYNKILFRSIPDLQAGKQIIIINELGSGGTIYGTKKYADKAFKKLQEALEDKYAVITNADVERGYKRIAFSIHDMWEIKL